MENLSANIIERSLSFDAYHHLFTDVITGKLARYNEKQVHFTELNSKRLARLLKKDRLLAEAKTTLQNIDRPLHWLVITEPWCGDAAQVVPPLVQLANQSDAIQLSFILRDQELEIMDQFLTNGSRAIPKVIILDKENNNQILGTWGPRPADAQAMMLKGLDQWRSMPESEEKAAFYADLYANLQRWYTRDKTVSTQQEFLNAVQQSLVPNQLFA